MSLLRLIFGSRQPAPLPPPPPPPPRTDLLTLTGAGLDGADTGAAGTVTVTFGDRTFTATATRRGAALDFALSEIHEVVPEPEPEPEPVEEVVEPEPAPVLTHYAEDEVAVIRKPVIDGDGTVIGYELVAASRSIRGTAGLLVDAFGDIGLERLAGRHPAWVRVQPEFLLTIGTPPVRPDKVVLQFAAEPVSDEVLTALRRLQFSGYTLALEGFDARLLTVCGLLKVSVAGRSDEELAALIAEPLAKGVKLVATDVATREEQQRCQALGFTAFQGDFFAKPDLTRQRRVGTGGETSLQALAAVTAADATFEDLEAAITSDVGLSLKLLRYVNSAFFALPRTVESVREALTLLGTATVRRWATVVALAAAADAPDELVELALQRARMCEVLGGSRDLDGGDAAFTVGLFSVADALLDAPMQDVLETLPFSDEIRTALLRREGPKGELLDTVVAYERGEFPADDGSLQGAYGDAVEWAGGAVGAAS
jgi:EAL and modified HD-GYP domain-containing signal transduction protein